MYFIQHHVQTAGIIISILGMGNRGKKEINATVFNYLLILGTSCLEHTCVSFPGNSLFLQVGCDMRCLREAWTCGIGDIWGYGRYFLGLFYAPGFRGGCSCRSRVRGDVSLRCQAGSPRWGDRVWTPLLISLLPTGERRSSFIMSCEFLSYRD